MSGKSLIIIAALAVSFAAQAQTPAPPATTTPPAAAPARPVSPANINLQSFEWPTGVFTIRFTVRNQSISMRGDLKDGERQTYSTKDGLTKVEIKSYREPLFVVIAITTESDPTGYIFMLERPEQRWLLMNNSAIRSRKQDMMNDLETAMSDFEKMFKEMKQKTNHEPANIFRKVAEYFQKNPDRRLQNLLSDLEARDPSLNVIPPPRSAARNNDQGVTVPGLPAEPRGNRPMEINPGNRSGITYPPPEPDDLDDEYQQPAPQPRRRPQRPPVIDPYTGEVRPPGNIPGEGRNWVDGERQRQRQRNQYIDPNTGQPRYYPSDRGMQPRYNQPQYAPQPQYPRQQYQPNFFERLFGQ